MNRIQFCQACRMIANGIKSRTELKHTCDLERSDILDFETEKNQMNISFDLNKEPYTNIDQVKKPKPPKPKY